MFKSFQTKYFLAERRREKGLFSKKTIVSLLGLLLFVAQVMVINVMGSVPPVAVFTHLPESPLTNELVVFDASASYDPDGEVKSYKWNFGDGSAIITIPDPVTSHTYTTRGNYTVTLTVTDNGGLTGTTSATLTVIEHPVATFTYSPASPLVGETATFDASLSTPNGGTITSYYWSFGDGAHATVVTVTHAYVAVGDYNVTLTITDSEGLVDTAWKLITVVEHPVAVFGYKPSLPLVNEVVKFDASDSVPNGGTIVNYTWNFGDGSPEVTETDPTTTYAYTTFGIYNVILTIVDSEGLTDTCSDTIRVLTAPTAIFTHLPTKPIVDETVTFDASTSYDPDGAIVSYFWNFGDGATTNVTDPTVNHTYAVADTFNVTLTITDDDGLTDSVSKLVVVYTIVYTHDVAVVSVVTSRAKVYVGRTVDITVVARNEGDSPETIDVVVYYGDKKVGTQTVSYLLPDNEKTLVFHWNTAGVVYGNYIISAQVTLKLAVDDDPADNTLIDGWVLVTIVGDVDGNRVVDADDVFMYVAPAYGSETGSPKYNPDCDFDENGRVDADDVFTYLARNYGKSV